MQEIKREYELIIPVALRDVPVLEKSLPYIKKNLSPKKIIIISNLKARDLIENMHFDNVKFCDENSLIPNLTFDTVKQYLSKYNTEKSTGWYFQQFLKMGYALVTDCDYYMSWDSDTLPLTNIEMFEDDKIIFSLKKEYNKPYFDTIESLLQLKKCMKQSFIAEHMMFKTEYMKELLDVIQSKDKNNEWFINILEAIPKESLCVSGFSEFETYGTYVYNYHHDAYLYKNIKAIRKGKMIFGEVPNDNVMEWLGKHYLSISFEKSQEQVINNKSYNSALFRNIIPSNIYIFFCLVRIKLNSIFNN